MIVDHIKRCYLIPVAVGLALLFLLRVSLVLDGGGAIRTSLFWPVFLIVTILFCIGIADIIFAIINRRTRTGTLTDIGFVFLVLVFFAVPVSLGLGGLLLYIAIAGVASAFINGRTETAIVSGIAVLALGAPHLVVVLEEYIILNRSLSKVGLLIILPSFSIGGGILAVAFITHTNMALSKLRILYLIPLILLVPFQFFMVADIFFISFFQMYSFFQFNFSFITEAAPFLTVVSILAGGGILAVAFIAHSNMELYKKALYFIPFILLAPYLLLLLARWSFTSGDLFTIERTLWHLLQHWIIGGCIMMGINRIIYTNSTNINPHKDSLEL